MTRKRQDNLYISLLSHEEIVLSLMKIFEVIEYYISQENNRDKKESLEKSKSIINEIFKKYLISDNYNIDYLIRGSYLIKSCQDFLEEAREAQPDSGHLLNGRILINIVRRTEKKLEVLFSNWDSYAPIFEKLLLSKSLGDTKDREKNSVIKI